MGENKDHDPPIEPQEFRGGVKVVDIGDIRVARGLSRRAFSGCHHRRLHYDVSERRVWCPDCERNIEAFDAFEIIVSRYDTAVKSVQRREEAVTEAERFQARSKAAQELDRVWRGRTMVPACPHCGLGLFPEDFKHGCGMLNREYAEALARKRKREAEMTPAPCPGTGETR